MALKTEKSMTKSQFELIKRRHPMGFGQPIDVAEAVAFLLSDSSKWINAITLPVDGGYLAY
jgi:NAD(P)-dependent dehydrogenase (short-subunit alcohol dehydrogenase family)